MKDTFKVIIQALQQKEFSVLIFIAFFFLFCYPFAIGLENFSLIFAFQYFFTVWAVLVGVLFISNHYADTE